MSVSPPSSKDRLPNKSNLGQHAGDYAALLHRRTDYRRRHLRSPAAPRLQDCNRNSVRLEYINLLLPESDKLTYSSLTLIP